jgi:hypothetical protein
LFFAVANLDFFALLTTILGFFFLCFLHFI